MGSGVNHVSPINIHQPHTINVLYKYIAGALFCISRSMPITFLWVIIAYSFCEKYLLYWDLFIYLCSLITGMKRKLLLLSNVTYVNLSRPFNKLVQRIDACILNIWTNFYLMYSIPCPFLCMYLGYQRLNIWCLKLRDWVCIACVIYDLVDL